MTKSIVLGYVPETNEPIQVLKGHKSVVITSIDLETLYQCRDQEEVKSYYADLPKKVVKLLIQRWRERHALTEKRTSQTTKKLLA